ncbi:AMP-dependent synthetase and ligase family protein [Striga asiatica]|uniref:AMP-dependent synthetase and ligase family protein n=1 Tax=Striga asiatica TaxID=4170 RepID=A0A5A7QFP7_STRAF|nr:AMP-dependent synthetase and ligase family protein [Striga asiatica]
MNHFLRRWSSSHSRCSINFVNESHPWKNLSSRHLCGSSSEDREAVSWKSLPGLVKCPANHAPLTPISFLERAARVFRDRTSVVYVHLGRDPREVPQARFCSDPVATLAPNVPAMVELHFAVPMAGAIICTLNTRHDPAMISALLRHSEAKILFSDHHLLTTARSSLEKTLKPPPILVQISDNAPSPDTHDYESLISSGVDESFVPLRPESEFDPISINYTSGTTSRPKGVVYNHRGAYLNALATSFVHGMTSFPVYLWTVPMFHCNGWCLVWGLAALGGTSVCIRRPSPDVIFDQIALHGVTHMSGAPTVLNAIVNSPASRKPLPHKVEIMTGGAPPPEPVLLKIEDLGFRVSHLYGLTETYGPGTWCAWRPEWDSLGRDERARLKARQGVGHYCLEEVDVRDLSDVVNSSVPADGVTIGEIVFRGNTVMAGYLKDEKATREAFADGWWFRSGDLGVKHADGYIEVKDRWKDVVITGGENVCTVEVERVIYRHAAVDEVAVVGRPDEHWGESLCAFVKVREGCESEVGVRELMDFCRERLPHYMAPKTVVFGELPKTSTGKVQKFVLRERAKAMGKPDTINMGVILDEVNPRLFESSMVKRICEDTLMTWTNNFIFLSMIKRSISRKTEENSYIWRSPSKGSI